MKHFISAKDVDNLDELVAGALAFKKDPYQSVIIGQQKTLGLLFFNPSLRTRLSTVKAAKQLGLEVVVMNVGQDSWKLETEEGAIMDGDKAEHIREAAAVMGAYCDIIGVRSFPALKDRENDYQEKVIKAFVKYADRPILNLESATVHPLQSLADIVTIEEYKKIDKPKIVLTWVPHVKALPQSVGNSFAEWMGKADFDCVVAAPKGFQLDASYTQGLQVTEDQEKALEGADFVYAKNWSAYENYGAIGDFPHWMIDARKLSLTNDAYFMHCLPVRRNVVVSDEVLDSQNAIHIPQSGNRIWATQSVLFQMLKDQ